MVASKRRDVVAIDTGGTFTDLSAVLADGARVRLKVPSTPDDPGRAVLDAIEALQGTLGHPLDLAEVRHGTTVATNALLERRGARVVLVTTAGFEDLLRLRRQDRPDLYALHPVVPKPLVAPEDCIGVRGRIGPDGAVVEPLEDPGVFVRHHIDVLKGADAFAVCLLHSYVDGRHEAAIGAALTTAFPHVPVTLSHDIAPVFREYERTSTTAVNAFVAPVMTGYLRRLAEAIAPASLRVQSSAGGLIPAETARREAVQTVLSGPAGGVAGAWQVGVRNGRKRLLAVDMGGTSTDVSVLDGGLAPEDDGHLDEHPLRIPLLPIETVGAGGGSIAFIDSGGMLRVGPRSAGAVPGPACYGRAGADAEPTVTDAHVVLGHLPSLLGGAMPLFPERARGAVGRLASRLGRTVEETADAIVAIATANMARACKRVSMARGIDPRGLSLVAFGGAGGLHACDLADALGCTDVIFAGHGGVLSAEGIAAARPQADHRRTVFRTLAVTKADGWPVERLVADHIRQTRARLTAQWPSVQRADIAVTAWADCRYVGQTYTLAVALGDRADVDIAGRFAECHRSRYGYALDDRPVELVSLRASATEAGADEQRTAVLSDTSRDGPAAIPRYGATLWLPAGWRATENDDGDVICRPIAAAQPAGSRDVDPLHLAIHRSRVAAIAEQMGEVLMSAAFSANIKERRDFSCAVFDRHGRMVAHAAHIPVHLGSTPASVAAAIAAMPMTRGSHVVLNDPYAGGTHLPDVTVVSPVHIGDGHAPAFYIANRAHHADVGGIAPGSMPAPFDADGTPRSLTIDDEGIRLPPSLLDDDLVQRFATASRTPDERRGDLRAQVAANDAAREWLRELTDELGLDAFERNNDALIAYAEARMRAVIAAIPDGTYRFEDALDDDGTSDDAIPIPVALTVAGDEATVDLRAAADCRPGPLNAVRAIADSAVFYVFRTVAGAVSGEGGRAMPANAGLMAPITVLTRPGSMLDAIHPAAVSSGNVETSQRLVDALLGAMAGALPDAVPAASCGSMNNVLLGGDEPASWVHYETLAGGGGGGPAGPGADAIHCHMTNTLNTPVEALERAFPVRIERYAVRDASDFDAAEIEASHRGGHGVTRVYRFLDDASVTLVTERRRIAPWSRGTDVPGTRGYNAVVRVDGGREELAGKCTVAVRAGDTLEVHTPGGGHFEKEIATAPKKAASDRRPTPSAK